MLWSAKNNCFFLPTEGALIQAPDAIPVDDQVFDEFGLGVPPAGKVRVVGKDDMPSWGDIPPPTHEELIAAAEAMKQSLISQANDYMNSKQWPGKAAIGRLKGEDLARYNAWLDYLDALDAVDISPAPDVIWPEKPA